MKKITLSILTTVFLCITSCTEKPNPHLVFEDPFFSLKDKDGVEQTKFELEAEFFSETFTITSNSKWEIKPDENAEWITINPSMGSNDGKTVIAVLANPVTTPRPKATISVYIKDEVFKSFEVTQAGANPEISVSPISPVITYEGGEVSLTIMGESEGWRYEIIEIEDGNSWLSEKTKEANQLVMNVLELTTSRISRKALLRFWVPNVVMDDLIVTITQKNLTADLLDIQFNNDGTAIDISPMQMEVQTFKANTLNTYWNETYQRYTAQFDQVYANPNATGFYKIDYETISDKHKQFRAALEDGHSLEALVMLNRPIENKEIKSFSSHQGGGVGLMITTMRAETASENQLTYLPNVNTSPATASKWVWNPSGTVPNKGMYYHMVGVWDKERKETRIYINGELKGTTATGDLLKLASDGARWFAVGGDSKPGDVADGGWSGDVVIARVYDDALDQTKVTRLWDQVKSGQNDTKTLRIDDAGFGEDVVVNPGSVFIIGGSGFEAGDIICLESMTDESSIFSCATTIVSDVNAVKAVLPDNIVSDTYRIMVIRGTQRYAIGVSKITVEPGAGGLKLPKVVAHRGYWAEKGNTGTTIAPHNSIASLQRAQTIGAFGSELDIWKTTDDKLVLYHDAILAGTSTTIENVASSELESFNLPNGEALPTLDAYLTEGAKNQNTKLIIEIKTHGTSEKNLKAADLTVAMVEAKGMKGNVEYIAFNYEICKRILERAPDAIVGYLNGDKAPSEVNADGIKSIDYQHTIYTKKPEWIREAHQLGMVVNIWTVNSRSAMIKYIAAGVDLITTDDPETLAEIIAKLSE